ncbi:MAG: hypothetical protein Q9207_005164, partial [Kuettlingeria erythrocarpa]
MSIPTIVVIGSLNTDLITRTIRFPNPGETLTASSFSTGSGGKGANQAVACARLSRSKPKPPSGSRPPACDTASSQATPGQTTTTTTASATFNATEPTTAAANVRMIGAVGSDKFGTRLKDGLESNGVHVDDIRVIEGETTGTAVIIVDESTGENRILITPGANSRVVPSSLPESLFTAPPLPSLVILQLEIPLPTVVHVITSAKRKGVPVLLNPAPAVELPGEVYAGLEHLVLNETEAQILAGMEKTLAVVERGGGGCGAGLRETCMHFHGLGVRNVILTLGGEGVYWSSSSTPSFSSTSSSSMPQEQQQQQQQQQHIPASRVDRVVDTTAAGDT